MKLAILLFLWIPLFSQISDTSHFRKTDGMRMVFSKNEKAGMLLQLISGAADGLNQSIQFHGLGAGKPFWDYQTSWKRKYRDYDNGDYRSAYFLSKSALVAGTDGYHLTRFVSRSTMMATIIIDKTELKDWKKILKKVIILSIANRIGFYITYNIFQP